MNLPQPNNNFYCSSGARMSGLFAYDTQEPCNDVNSSKYSFPDLENRRIVVCNTTQCTEEKKHHQPTRISNSCEQHSQRKMEKNSTTADPSNRVSCFLSSNCNFIEREFSTPCRAVYESARCFVGMHNSRHQPKHTGMKCFNYQQHNNIQNDSTYSSTNTQQEVFINSTIKSLFRFNTILNQYQIYQIICILCLCMIILVLNNSLIMVVGMEEYLDLDTHKSSLEKSSRATYQTTTPSAYMISELETQFCLACTLGDSNSMTFQENIHASNKSSGAQLLFMSVGNDDMSKVDITFQAIPNLSQKFVLVLSSMNVVTFNVRIEESFPLERVICHSPIQSTVLISPLYEHQALKNIPVQYYCVKGSRCDYKILTTTSTVGWYGGGQLFTELMSNHLQLGWRAFSSCSKATKISVQPIGWPCAAVSDELIIYMTLTLFLFCVSFASCIVLVLLRWYCIRLRAREEYLLKQSSTEFSDDELRAEPKIIQLRTTTMVVTTTNTAPTMVQV